MAESTVAITVLSAQQQAAALQSQVDQLIESGVLDKGASNSLKGKLDLKGNPGDHGKVRAFLNVVDSLVKRGALSPSLADPLLEAGEILLASLTTSER